MEQWTEYQDKNIQRVVRRANVSLMTENVQSEGKKIRDPIIKAKEDKEELLNDFFI